MIYTILPRALSIALWIFVSSSLGGCAKEDTEESVSGAMPPRSDDTKALSAEGSNAEGLSAVGAYLRQPAPGQKMLAAFVTFKNESTDAFTLNHISSPRASAIEVHRTLYQDGVMSMRKVNHLVVPPRGELVFKPGGHHLMLSGVSGDFAPGDQIPLTFSFEGGVTLEILAEVRPIH